MPKLDVVLTPEQIKAICDIINRGNRVEIGIRSGKICIWEVHSKTKHETPIM